jgi:hypothetical protein
MGIAWQQHGEHPYFTVLVRGLARDVQKSCSQDQQILCRSLPDGGERNAGIKSNEPSSMLNRESKQVYVGQLPRPMNSGRVHDIRIQQTDLPMTDFTGGARQQPLLPVKGSGRGPWSEDSSRVLGDLRDAILESWQVVDLDTDIAESAARLRASLHLKLPDAVQAATALAINADALVTHDRDFSRLKSLRVIS